ncbi:MAG: peptidylprolyl isomerase [Helicobacteraceae bacterium]|jgi:peptidylprolyl isomerase|nr:peptidylprolyl isomerase [Helicobacteraceae bacterium]
MKNLARAALIAALAMAANAATLATVNGEKIDSEDINVILKQQGASYDKLSKEQQEQLLDQVIERKLVSQAAKKAGVEKKEDYKRALAIVSEQIATDFYIREKFDAITASEAETKKLYEESKDKFSQPAQVRARHILVEKEGDAKSIIDALSKKKGKDLEDEFEKLAKEKSKDAGSAVRGGDLGYFTEKDMVKEFSQAAFSQKVGEVSKKPIKSDFGYHIIYVVDSKKAGLVPYADVAEQLKQNVKAQKFEKLMEKELKDIKDKAKITK